MDNQLSEAECKEIEFDLNCARDDAAERVRNQLHFADKGTTAMFMANGGAIIGLFTFIGNTIGKTDTSLRLDTSWLWYGFIFFVAGIALCLVAHFWGLLSQYQFYNQAVEHIWRLQRDLKRGVRDSNRAKEQKHHIKGMSCFYAGIFCMFAALACFISGSCFALKGVLVSQEQSNAKVEPIRAAKTASQMQKSMK